MMKLTGMDAENVKEGYPDQATIAIQIRDFVL